LELADGTGERRMVQRRRCGDSRRRTRAGRFVGSELDLRAILRASDTQTFSIGYSRFFAGSFVKDTGPARDADFLYVMSQWRFSGK